MMASQPTPDEMCDQEDISSTEKTANVSQSDKPQEDYAEGHGDFQVTMVPGGKNVKLAKDGRIVLIPQPSDDPDDVLNWKAGKKFRVLLSLVFASLVTGTNLPSVNWVPADGCYGNS
jgi:hypothetical protein